MFINIYYTPNKHPTGSKVDSIFLSKSTDAEWIKFIHTLKYYYEISVVVLTDKVKAGILERELWIDAG